VSTASDFACNIAWQILSSFTFVTAMNTDSNATLTATRLFKRSRETGCFRHVHRRTMQMPSMLSNRNASAAGIRK